MLKKVKKSLLGENYHQFRSKNILKKIFGDTYIEKQRRWKYFIKKFNFIKIKLDKKTAGQSLIKNEKGFLIDLTLNNYLTYHLRPKLSQDFDLESTCEISEKFAVIIQGPIKENSDFLKHTLKIYKKIFKNSLIIVSTWEDENKELIEELHDENIHIILSDDKEIKKSRSNINKQIISTNVALNFAKTQNVKYCLKTRTDQRIYNNNLETFLISLLKTFPVKENKLIKSRILVPPMGTFKFFLYHLTDLMMFGETQDLINYWDKESYDVGLKKMGLNEKKFFINDTPLCPETFLCSRFIGKIEDNVVWDLENWWRCLRDYFCIIDNSSLDSLWFKYEWEVEYRYLKTYSDKISRTVDFHEWLSLYNNSKNNWHLYSNEHEKFEEFNDSYRGTNLFL
tara:strand:- start:44 stop:1231 length:1188 start_codon:yes stop_codon:yes gene_type:complete